MRQIAVGNLAKQQLIMLGDDETEVIDTRRRQ
jgi:hypothetical protein